MNVQQHTCAGASAQLNQTDMPSIGTARGTVQVANRTNVEVVFYLTSPNTKRTEHRLAPSTLATFSGEPGDTWFNIEVHTETPRSRETRRYGLDSGARHYIEYDANGVLDVYLIPPGGRTARGR